MKYLIAAYNYIIRVLVGADFLVNALLNGSPYETLSSRAHRMRVKKQPYWWWLADVIDALFFLAPNHCERMWRKENG